MPPKSKEERLARVQAAMDRFEKRIQKPWLKRKAAMTSQDYARTYLRKIVKDAQKESA